MNFLEFLAQYRTEWADIFFQAVTYLAQEAFVIVIICWLYWRSNKKLAYTLGFSYFTSGLLVQGLKITFRVPRPWVLDPGFHPVESAVPDATGYSFPSGHTQSCTSLFGTLGFFTRKLSLRILCGCMIFLIGFSRMYLGCHTPQDVLVSFGVSILCTYLSYYLLYRKELLNGKEKITSVCIALVCAHLVIYTLFLYKRGIIELKYASDCVKAAGAGMAFSIGYYIEKTYLNFQAPDSLREKLLRFAAGLAVTLALQTGLKPILGTSFPASFIRYFLVVAWAVILYPMLFSRKKSLSGSYK